MIGRVEEIERRLGVLEALLAEVLQRLTAVEQGLSKAWSGAGGGSGSGIVYLIPAASAPVIAAGGSVTGQSVYELVAGSPLLVSTAGTVYNAMGVPTVIGKTIICGGNPDGTYTAVSQSC